MSHGEKPVQQLIEIVKSPPRPGHGNRYRKITYVYRCNHCGTIFRSKLKNAGLFCSRECSHAFRRIKPESRTCEVCGKNFLQRDYYDRRKTCSEKCAEVSRRKNIPYDSPERSRKLSESCKRLQSHRHLHTSEVRKKAGPSISAAKEWVPTKGKAGLGVPKKNRLITFLDPDGVPHATKCVRHFVRQHPELFHKDDVKRQRKNQTFKGRRSTLEGNMSCRAMNGLGDIVCHPAKTWKGWKVLSVENFDK